MSNLKIGFPEKDENQFNSWVTDTLNAIDSWRIIKFPGSCFKGNMPDHIGVCRETFVLLENKFIPNLKIATRGSTIMVGKGCSNKRKTWSPGQLDEIQKFMNACHGKGILGGLVGVLGTRSKPDIVLGVPASEILSGFYITAAELRELREEVDLENGAQPYLFFDVWRRKNRSLGSNPYLCLDDLLYGL